MRKSVLSYHVCEEYCIWPVPCHDQDVLFTSHLLAKIHQHRIWRGSSKHCLDSNVCLSSTWQTPGRNQSNVSILVSKSQFTSIASVFVISVFFNYHCSFCVSTIHICCGNIVCYCTISAIAFTVLHRQGLSRLGRTVSSFSHWRKTALCSPSLDLNTGYCDRDAPRTATPRQMLNSTNTVELCKVSNMGRGCML